MYYSIERVLSILPYLSWLILILILAVLEGKNYHDQLRDEPKAEPGRGGFIPPPGDGYEYYVHSGSIVYILQKARQRFRIYVIQGEFPHVKRKQDRYGSYFTVNCQDSGTAESIVDRAFGQ